MQLLGGATEVPRLGKRYKLNDLAKFHIKTYKVSMALNNYIGRTCFRVGYSFDQPSNEANAQLETNRIAALRRTKKDI
jgi:hypothetical protein